MPHVCGDEPNGSEQVVAQTTVCPTYVGMNRRSVLCLDADYGMPHACGDEPTMAQTAIATIGYAPRMWG